MATDATASPPNAQESIDTPAASTSTANVAAAEASSDTSKDAANKDDVTNGEAAATTQGDASGAEVVAPDANADDSSAKKKDKRRSSAGVPEHKAKKLNRKKSQATLQLDAEPGDHYWARLKGYPPWPAVICDDEMLPEPLLQNRPVTAKRPDGSYRDDFLPGGKNVRERTYPVMYLGTYEFSWAPNTDLTPLKREDVQDATQGKKTKSLFSAYEQAAEFNSLEHYKSTLAGFQTEKAEYEEAAQQEEERKAQLAAEKQERKEKKEQKTKRKSKTAVDDEDEDMPDAEDDGSKKAPKPKKRKKEADSDGDAKSARTPKSIKLQVSKTPNSEAPGQKKSKSKAAATPKSTTKAEPPMSETEKKEKRQKEILYFRHRLQKGFLSREAPPKEEDMAQMAQYFDSLESVKSLEATIIRETRIHKVLKGIMKLESIPKDEEFDFKDRSKKLLDAWNKVLGDEPGPSDAKQTNGTASSAKTDGEKPAGSEEKPSEAKDEVKTPAEAPVEQVTPGDDAKDEATDVPMIDAKEEAPMATDTTADSPKPDAAAEEATAAGAA